MVRIHHRIPRLKNTFQCTRPYNDVTQQKQRLTGRRVSSIKTLLYLPSNPDSNYNMNVNEISLSSSSPLFSSLITKKQKIHHDEHDLQQSKLKNLVIHELQTFFISRNQNHQQQNDDRSPETNVKFETSISIQQRSTQSSNKVILTKTNENSKRLLSIRASTTLLTRGLIRSSQKFSNVLNLLSTQCIKQTKFFYMKSLLLHACFMLFPSEKILSSRIVTSILHLIAGFMIPCADKNNI